MDNSQGSSPEERRLALLVQTTVGLVQADALNDIGDLRDFTDAADRAFRLVQAVEARIRKQDEDDEIIGR